MKTDQGVSTDAVELSVVVPAVKIDAESNPAAVKASKEDQKKKKKKEKDDNKPEEDDWCDCGDGDDLSCTWCCRYCDCDCDCGDD
jgi:ribosomal protein L12E/L44/L45/RPP1/RPP2